jgi:hypothetical protein
MGLCAYGPCVKRALKGPLDCRRFGVVFFQFATQ